MLVSQDDERTRRMPEAPKKTQIGVASDFGLGDVETTQVGAPTAQLLGTDYETTAIGAPIAHGPDFETTAIAPTVGAKKTEPGGGAPAQAPAHEAATGGGAAAAHQTSKKTQVGVASDFGKTITDTSSVERMLASLDEWSAPPSEPKLPAAAPSTRGLPTAVGAPSPFAAPAAAVPAPAPGTQLMAATAAPPLAAPAFSPAPATTAPEPAPAPRAPTFGKTMIGGSISADEVRRESERQVELARQAAVEDTSNKTMIGVATVDKPAFVMAPGSRAPEPPKQDVAWPAPQPAPAESQAPVDPQAYRPAFKTMLGVAMPGIAPVRDSERSLKIQQEQTLQGGVGAAPSSSRQRALPPTQDMPATPAPPPVPPTPRQPPPPIVPPPAPLVEEPLPQAPRVVVAEKKGGVPAVAVVAIVGVLVALVGAGAAVYILRSSSTLTAQAQLDDSGKESLALHCASCADGTKVSLGASSTVVTKGDALLPLPAPLSIGDNPLEITLDRPGAGRDEKVKIHVPIAYRVKADLTTLSAEPPVVTVRVEAQPGTDVTVDSKPVALDASGKGAYTLDVSADATGPSDEQKTIDRKIPFSVRRKGAQAAEPGELVVRAGIVPLHIDAPGLELTTDRATANVVGQTKPGGAITVDGQTVALDGTGHYQIRAELPATGDKTLTIVANAPPLAPRTVKAKVTRVASLVDAANALDGQNPLGFEAYAADPASKVDQLVAINGEIQEIRVQSGHTLMVVEEKKSCGANVAANLCLVRLVHGEDVNAKRGDTIRAYGKLTGAVPFQSRQIPAVSGTLVIATPKGAKK